MKPGEMRKFIPNINNFLRKKRLNIFKTILTNRYRYTKGMRVEKTKQGQEMCKFEYLK